MADIADQSQDWIDRERELRVQAQVAGAEPLAKGKAGDCDFCGEWSSRLIDGACAPCRDRLRLK